jgi:uncharacterized protein (PEP-CTERM system associated)
MSASFRVWIAAAAVVLVSPAARAQDENRGSVTPGPSQAPASGWTVTPTLLYSTSWDDNVLLRGSGDPATGDLVNVVNPRMDLNFTGRYTQFSMDYDGAFLLYRQLQSLNSYDQHASLSARTRVSRRLTLFVSDTAAASPTTQLVELVGVPFERTGSRIEDAHGGVEATLTKRTSLVASYHFQWVQFDQIQAYADALRGGHSNGASASLRHVLSAHTTLLADYDVEHAQVGAAGDLFDVQNSSVGLDRKLSERLHVYGAVGMSHLNVSALGPARTGPSWRAGLTRQFREAGVDVSYSRSFVPSYGFGGTMQNEDLTTRLRWTLSRSLSVQVSGTWSRNEPLTPGDLPLRTLWADATLGYQLQRWARVELFVSGTQQTIDRAGGVLDHNRVGIQIVTTKPMRVR